MEQIRDDPIALPDRDASPAREVRIENLSHSYAGILALDSVSMTIAPGHIHSLVGQNGSGKSTLVKILSGYQAPNEGSLWLWDRFVHFPVRSPKRHGLSVIHQSTTLVDDISAVESFGIGSGHGVRGLRRISWNRERSLFASYAEKFGVTMPPDQLVGNMRAADRAILVILRALRQLEDSGTKEKLLILDEPSVHLPAVERRLLGEAIISVASSGIAVLLVSHNIDEVLTLSTRISVLRNGHMIDTVKASETTKEELVDLILGRRLSSAYPMRPKASNSGCTVLSIERLSGEIIRDLSITVQSGEIVGVTGLVGMGQDELPYLVIGAKRPHAGKVVFDSSGNAGDRTDSTRAGWGRQASVVPANRGRDALWMDGSVLENITAGVVKRYTRYGRIRRRHERHRVAESLQIFGVTPNRGSLSVRMLSGGNQQKVVLARALQSRPRLLILHEPTQGVDVGARYEILSLVCEAVNDGMSVLMCSADYQELAAVCNRVLVLSDGRVVADVQGEALTEDSLARACQGILVA